MMLYEVVLDLGWDSSRYYVHSSSPTAIHKAAEKAGLKVLEIQPWRDCGPTSWPHPDDIFEDINTWIAHVQQR